MGDTYIADGSYDQALDAYAAAVERARSANRDDLSLQPLMEIGQLATFMGEHQRAEAAYQEADGIDPLIGNVLFGMLVNSGEAGQIDEMLAVRDTAMARFADLPPIAENQVELVSLLIDALVAYYSGDAQASVQLFDEARELIGAQRPAAVGAPGQEALALIEAGRGREALPMADMLERTARDGNRMDPGRWHSALYVRGRAHEALGETDKAVEAYEELLAMIGDSAREISFWADAPDRLAALQAGAAGTSG